MSDYVPHEKQKMSDKEREEHRKEFSQAMGKILGKENPVNKKDDRPITFRQVMQIYKMTMFSGPPDITFSLIEETYPTITLAHQAISSRDFSKLRENK